MDDTTLPAAKHAATAAFLPGPPPARRLPPLGISYLAPPSTKWDTEIYTPDRGGGGQLLTSALVCLRQRHYRPHPLWRQCRRPHPGEPLPPADLEPIRITPLPLAGRRSAHGQDATWPNSCGPSSPSAPASAGSDATRSGCARRPSASMHGGTSTASLRRSRLASGCGV